MFTFLSLKMLVSRVGSIVTLSLLHCIMIVTCVNSSADMSCPTWMYHSNGSAQCVCGVDMNTKVLCDPLLEQVKVSGCHMTTLDPSRNEVIAGYSFYRCVKYFNESAKFYFPVNSNTLQINFETCDQFNRDGAFCGACKEGFSPLVYSYKLHCKRYLETEVVWNWFTFLAIAFLPLTLFYIFILLFKFNVNSPSLHGFVLLAQMLTQTSSTKLLIAKFDNSHGLIQVAVLTLQTLYSVWNLNFFRAFSPDICFRISTLEALSLEYVIAFYPLFLIMTTYIGTELHSQGLRIIVLIWRPFQKCLNCFRKQWNIKSSLIDVFATFLLLSYNRILDISFSLMMYTSAYNSRGELVGRYLYYDSSKEFFGEEHRPFGILAAFVLFFFNFVPFLLLLLYPMKWFQRCLNHFRLSRIALHTFADSFVGCYKDGTEAGTRDLRYFAALFFLYRFVNCLAVACTYDGYYFIIFPIIIVCFSIIFISAQPYRSKFSHHNTTMMFFLMLGIVICCCCYGISFTDLSRPGSSISLLSFCFCILILPHIYVTFLMLRWLYDRLPWGKLCHSTSKCMPHDNRVSSESPLVTGCSNYNSF